MCDVFSTRNNKLFKIERLLDANRPSSSGHPLPVSSPLLSGCTNCPRRQLAAKGDRRDPRNNRNQGCRLPPTSGERGEGPAVGYRESPFAIGGTRYLEPGIVFRMHLGLLLSLLIPLLVLPPLPPRLKCICFYQFSWWYNGVF